jgi:hypothetical protein
MKTHSRDVSWLMLHHRYHTFEKIRLHDPHMQLRASILRGPDGNRWEETAAPHAEVLFSMYILSLCRAENHHGSTLILNGKWTNE